MARDIVTSENKAEFIAKKLGKMYRGEGEGSSEGKHIKWVTPHQALAQGYAGARRGGKVTEHDVSEMNHYDAGHDALEQKPKEFTARALNQSSKNLVNKSNALDARKNFLSHFSDEGSRNVTDYWSKEESKKHTKEFLERLGFNGIKLKEDDKDTYGIFHKS